MHWATALVLSGAAAGGVWACCEKKRRFDTLYKEMVEDGVSEKTAARYALRGLKRRTKTPAKKDDENAPEVTNAVEKITKKVSSTAFKRQSTEFEIETLRWALNWLQQEHKCPAAKTDPIQEILSALAVTSHPVRRPSIAMGKWVERSQCDWQLTDDRSVLSSRDNDKAIKTVDESGRKTDTSVTRSVIISATEDLESVMELSFFNEILSEKMDSLALIGAEATMSNVEGCLEEMVCEHNWRGEESSISAGGLHGLVVFQNHKTSGISLHDGKVLDIGWLLNHIPPNTALILDFLTEVTFIAKSSSVSALTLRIPSVFMSPSPAIFPGAVLPALSYYLKTTDHSQILLSDLIRSVQEQVAGRSLPVGETIAGFDTRVI
eukprot:TRINITY_DN7992_c0_g1_i1.p1 TRINITY_DN7992_c0_g1~~TRINITY_DN7992_c0_g1_i1.p1  ORF type:complete len:395 (+),score=60.83 TRINITY_DN7992_c0_g1_i1:54-1187(+)